MITPIRALTINQIIARQDDLLVTTDDIKKVAENERAKAEIEFQNSDYWNDYLAKVIADARAEERATIIDLIDRHMWNYSKEVWEDFQPNLKKLKEQK